MARRRGHSPAAAAAAALRNQQKVFLMTSIKSTVLAMAIVALPATVLAQGARMAPNTDPTTVQSGDYKLEPTHARVQWTLTHMGFSEYWGDFVMPTGVGHFDANNPAADTVDISIPAASVSTTNPTLDGEVKDWFEVAKYPTITFKSTKVVPTGPGSADVTGDLTLHGITKPVTLKVMFRAAGVNMMTKHYTIGFDAVATIKRSEFGVKQYVPAVSDEVQIKIAAPFEKQG
jgi:polyisoprenoid-binding protein YceI